MSPSYARQHLDDAARIIQAVDADAIERGHVDGRRVRLEGIHGRGPASGPVNRPGP
jgi:hypothetical protein